MSKHPLDHDRGASKGRLERFTAAAKADMPSKATMALQQRPRTQSDGKLKAFSRIEKTGGGA